MSEDELSEDQMRDALADCAEWAREFARFQGHAEDREAYHAALVSAVAMIRGVGGDPKKIAKLTTIDGRTVAKFGRRLSAGKMWDEGEITYDLEELQMAALVAMGFIRFTGEFAEVADDEAGVA